MYLIFVLGFLGVHRLYTLNCVLALLFVLFQELQRHLLVFSGNGKVDAVDNYIVSVYSRTGRKTHEIGTMDAEVLGTEQTCP